MKVSVLVAARRAVHLDLIRPSEFRRFYEWHTTSATPSSEGGNFWNNQNTRIGRRFGSAVRRAVVGGRLTYREAYALTGLRGDTFDEWLRRMEAIPRGLTRSFSDANIFIEAHRRYYGLDLCPGDSRFGSAGSGRTRFHVPPPATGAKPTPTHPKNVNSSFQI